MGVEFDEGTEVQHVSPVPSSAAVGNDDTTRTRAGGRASSVVHSLRLLLAALWLGAAVYFSFAVAPSAFAVLPSRELAGALVTRTLGVVNVGGVIVALVLLATVALGRRRVSRLALRAEAIALALILALCAVGHFVIAARLRAMRAAMTGTIDALAKDDPARVAFNDLHGYSVMALGVAMLAGLVALLLIARRTRH